MGTRRFLDSRLWRFCNRHGVALWNTSGFLMGTSVALGLTDWTVADITTNSVLLVTSLISAPFLWTENHRVRFWIDMGLVVFASVRVILLLIGLRGG